MPTKILMGFLHKCKHARHILRMGSSYKLVGSKNSVYTHYAGFLLCSNYLFVIIILAYIFFYCNTFFVQFFLILYANFIISLFFKFMLTYNNFFFVFHNCFYILLSVFYNYNSIHFQGFLLHILFHQLPLS